MRREPGVNVFCVSRGRVGRTLILGPVNQGPGLGVAYASAIMRDEMSGPEEHDGRKKAQGRGPGTVSCMSCLG